MKDIAMFTLLWTILINMFIGNMAQREREHIIIEKLDLLLKDK